MPESNLVYPHADNVHKTAEGSHCRDGSRLPAAVEFTFDSADSPSAVFNWYSAELGPLGWRTGTIDAAATGFDFTRDTSDGFGAEVFLNLDGSLYRNSRGEFQYFTLFQHDINSDPCAQPPPGVRG